MVQLIRYNIQNQSFYVENVSQDLDFWFQHLKGVHFGKNDTRISFLVVINECITITKVRGTHVRWNSVTTIEIPLLLLWRSTMRTMAPLSSSESWITFYWKYGLNFFWSYLQFTWHEVYLPHFFHGDAFIYNNQKRYSCVIFSKMNTLKVLE